MSFTLSTPPDFNLSAVVRSHGWVQMSPFAETEDHGLSYVIRLATGKVTRFEVHVSTTGSTLQVNTTEMLEPAEELELTSTIAWMLALDQDFSEF